MKAGTATKSDMRGDPETEQNWCADVLQSLGFSEQRITKALESNGFCFPKALACLLNGGEASPNLSRFRRHTRKKVYDAMIPALAGESTRAEYVRRAGEHFGCGGFSVLDLGQYAASTTGACFWLCLAVA